MWAPCKGLIQRKGNSFLIPKGSTLFFMKIAKKTTSLEGKLIIKKRKVFRTILTVRFYR